MAFKVFTNRSVQYPNRRKLTLVAGTADVYDIAREEGTVFEEGVMFNEANMRQLTNEFELQLAEKASQAYVDTLATSLASGSPKGVYETESALISAFPSGNDNIYIVVNPIGDNNDYWYYWNGVVWTMGGVYQSTAIADSGVNAGNLDGTVQTLLDLLFATGENIVLTTINLSQCTISDGVITFTGAGYAQVHLDSSLFGFSIGDKVTIIAKSTYNNRNLTDYIKIRVNSDFNQYVKATYLGNGYYAIVDYTFEALERNLFIDNRTLAIPGLQIQLFCGKNVYPTINNNISNLQNNIKNVDNKDITFYVAPDGLDTNDGLSQDTPFATLNKAIYNSGIDTKILMKRGKYYNQGAIVYTNQIGKRLKITPYETSVYSGSVLNRPLIEIINGTKLASLATDSNGLLKQSFTGNTRFNNVFISKSVTPTVASGITDGLPNYSAGLWQIHDDISLDNRLLPVLTLAECISMVGSFFWDGSYIYINPFATAYTEFYVVNDDGVLNLDDYDGLELQDVVVKFGYANNIITRNIMGGKFQNVHSFYTHTSDGVTLDNSNLELYNCKSIKSRRDGFNIHKYGTSNLFDCDALYNGDDGISHHDGCKGFISGGKYNYNGKGGISPAYGAKVGITNSQSTNNKYGIYEATDDNHGNTEVYSNSNLFLNNQTGILCGVRNSILSVNDKLINNTTAISGTGMINQY